MLAGKKGKNVSKWGREVRDMNLIKSNEKCQISIEGCSGVIKNQIEEESSILMSSNEVRELLVNIASDE
jgi:hypothetical protein